MAKKLKGGHELGLALWDTGNVDARLVAILLIKPKALSTKELGAMVRSVTFPQLADWLNSYVVRNHPENESLRQLWTHDKNPCAARAGWSLTSEREQS